MRGSYGAKIMMHTSNILSGLAAVAMGGVLIFWIIPAQTVPTGHWSQQSPFARHLLSGSGSKIFWDDLCHRSE